MAKLEHSIDPAKYQSLDAATKNFYVQQGDKYVLDVDTTPAMTALEQERAARKAAEQKLAGYGDLTPEQVKALNEAKSKAEREKDFAAGNFEKILAEEKAKAAKDMELRDQRERTLLTSLQGALIDAEATRAIVANGGNPALLLPIIKGRTKLETVGDQQVAVVIGEKGGPLLKAGAQKADDYMPISEFVASMKADKTYAGAFASQVGSGSGRERGTVKQTPESQRQQNEMNATVEALKGGATRIGAFDS